MAATVREAEKRGRHLSPSEVVRDALCMWRAYQTFRAEEEAVAAADGGPFAQPASSAEPASPAGRVAAHDQGEAARAGAGSGPCRALRVVRRA
jgi:Arc/MetJ-type ribon-helix-helix transcriptional regulator